MTNPASGSPSPPRRSGGLALLLLGIAGLFGLSAAGAAQPAGQPRDGLSLASSLPNPNYDPAHATELGKGGEAREKRKKK